MIRRIAESVVQRVIPLVSQRYGLRLKLAVSHFKPLGATWSPFEFQENTTRNCLLINLVLSRIDEYVIWAMSSMFIIS